MRSSVGNVGITRVITILLDHENTIDEIINSNSHRTGAEYYCYLVCFDLHTKGSSLGPLSGEFSDSSLHHLLTS
jgi:hypothetical protein